MKLYRVAKTELGLAGEGRFYAVINSRTQTLVALTTSFQTAEIVVNGYRNKTATDLTIVTPDNLSLEP